MKVTTVILVNGNAAYASNITHEAYLDNPQEFDTFGVATFINKTKLLESYDNSVIQIHDVNEVGGNAADELGVAHHYLILSANTVGVSGCESIWSAVTSWFNIPDKEVESAAAA